MPHTSRLKWAIMRLLIRYAPLQKATILARRGPWPTDGTPTGNSPQVVMPQCAHDKSLLLIFRHVRHRRRQFHDLMAMGLGSVPCSACPQRRQCVGVQTITASTSSTGTNVR